MAKKQINYLAILGYVAQLAPLIAVIDADFSDDVTPEDRKKSTAHAIGATLTTAVQVISQNNPKYAEDLAALNGVIQTAITKYLAPSVTAPDAPTVQP
jgi:hypothetical protein